MFPELLLAAIARALSPWRAKWRRTWFYRQFTKGRMPDRIRHHPFDALPRSLEDADSLLKRRFRFAGSTLDVEDGSVFDRTPPSSAWAAALHGFDWLPALASAGGDPARALAVELVGEWIERNKRYSEPAWLPDVMARRLVHVFAHGRFVLANSDVLWRSKLFVSLREQAGQLGRIATEASFGLPRLEAAAALVLSHTCLEDNPRQLEAGLARLAEELSRQVLPDGGHVSRSPEDLLVAFRLIVMVTDGLTETGVTIPTELRDAHDRVAPMLRFFLHGDGALARFNGGDAGDARMIATLLARDEAHRQPFLHAPHSGYQRLAAGRSFVIIDCGAPPPGPYSCNAHAGSLAFEFGVGAQRVIVNCGPEKDDTHHWDGALRASAAQSTVTLADTSMVPVLAPGIARDLLGPRLLAAPCQVSSNRGSVPHGEKVLASHDYYVESFGIRHSREIVLSSRGTALSGSDRLIPQSTRRLCLPVPFAARFHIHPDVRVSPSQRGDILLKLPNGEGWRFRHGGTVTIEESVYVGDDGMRRSDQIVLSGTVGGEPVDIPWSLEQIGTD